MSEWIFVHNTNVFDLNPQSELPGPATGPRKQDSYGPQTFSHGFPPRTALFLAGPRFQFRPKENTAD